MESITTYSLDVLAMSRVSRSFRRALCDRDRWNDRLPELKGLMEKSPLEIASLLTWIEVGEWIKALVENPYPKGILMSFSSREGCLRLGDVLGPQGVSILAIVASARTSVAYFEHSMLYPTYACSVGITDTDVDQRWDVTVTDVDQHWDVTVTVTFVALVETIKVCVEFGAKGTVTAW
jgi:hypothetical protein